MAKSTGNHGSLWTTFCFTCTEKYPLDCILKIFTFIYSFAYLFISLFNVSALAGNMGGTSRVIHTNVKMGIGDSALILHIIQGSTLQQQGVHLLAWKAMNIMSLFVCCFQEVHFTLDRCSGAAVMEMEGLGSWMTTQDHSSCEVTGVTPNTDRYM